MPDAYAERRRPPARTRAASARCAADGGGDRVLRARGTRRRTRRPACRSRGRRTASNAARSSRAGARRARSAYRSREPLQQRVDPSMSVKRKVTVPVGRSGLSMTRITLLRRFSGSGRRALDVAGEQHRVAAAGREQLVVGTDLGDAAAVEHDDLVGVARPSRAGGRSRSWCGPPRAARAPPGRAAPSACRARRSPRRARGSVGCAAPSARSRSAASRRPRSGSRARRRPCRSRRAARRSARGSAPRAPPPRPPRPSPRASRSGGCRAPRSGRGRSPARRRRPHRASDSKVRSRTSTPSIATLPSVTSYSRATR